MARGLLLDASGRPVRQGLTILVPPSHADRPPPAFICLVPGCEVTFGEHERREYQEHTGRCARENMDKIRAQTAPHPVLGGDFDPEVTAHMRKVGQRMLAEGRMEVKPSERAGF